MGLNFGVFNGIIAKLWGKWIRKKRIFYPKFNKETKEAP